MLREKSRRKRNDGRLPEDIEPRDVLRQSLRPRWLTNQSSQLIIGPGRRGRWRRRRRRLRLSRWRPLVAVEVSRRNSLDQLLTRPTLHQLVRHLDEVVLQARVIVVDHLVAREVLKSGHWKIPLILDVVDGEDRLDLVSGDHVIRGPERVD